MRLERGGGQKGSRPEVDALLRGRCHHNAGLTSGQQTILELGGGAQLLDQEQPTDEKQQNNDQADQTSGLPLSRLILRVFIEPVVMSIHRSLHRAAY